MDQAINVESDETEVMAVLFSSYLSKKGIIMSAPFKKQLRDLRAFARHFLCSQSRRERQED